MDCKLLSAKQKELEVYINDTKATRRELKSIQQNMVKSIKNKGEEGDKLRETFISTMIVCFNNIPQLNLLRPGYEEHIINFDL